MKLRKTLAGILGAVVMLLGVGTFEHVNRETGVKAAVETVTLKYTIASTSSVTLSGNANGINATFKNTYTSNKQQLTKGNSATLTLSDFSNYEGYSVTGLTLSMKSNKSAGAGSLSVNLGEETIKSFEATSFNKQNWNGAYTTSFTDIKYTDFISHSIKSSDSLTITIAATTNSIYIESYTIEFSKESSGPVGLDVPTNLSINNYTGIATWDIVNNASGYNCIIDKDETNPIFVNGTSYQLENGQTIKVCSVGDGTNYLDSPYSNELTHNKILANSEVQKWISSYYNNGVYTKKSEIHLSEDADFELSEVIHHDEKQPVSLDRTTYYNDEALFMSNLDGSIGGEGQINSGYRTEGSDLRHFTLNSNNEPVNDWKVSNTTLKEFFVTLDNFRVDGYFDNWTLSENGEIATFAVTSTNNNSLTVKDFIAFAAPCLENIFEDEFANYFQLDRLTISQHTNNRDENYLSFRIYLVGTAYDSKTQKGTVDNSDCLLAESRIYAGNEVFDELECKKLTVSKYENGTITYTPEKDYYKENEVVTFTVSPNEGYYVESVLFNNKSVTEGFDKEGFTFDLELVNKENTVKVTFSLIPQAGEPVKFVFSTISESVQYAEETHQLDSNTSLYIKDCHINTQLRIYSSSSNNGVAIFTSTIAISELALNAGNKADTLLVYGSNDGGANWVEIGSITTTTSYKDYTLSFGGKTYTSIKLDVSGTQQVRIANITFTY